MNTINKNVNFHPFILACLPVLILFSFNTDEIPITDIFVPIIISIFFVIIFWLALKYLLRTTKSELIVSFLILLFVIYGNVFSLQTPNENIFSNFLSSHLILGSIFLSVGILGIIFFKKTNAIKELNSIFNVVAIAIMGVLILNILFYYILDSSDENYIEFVELPIILNIVDDKPDVFVFIFDEFAGSEQLKNDFNYDLTPFRENLTKRGFQIPSISFSNYPNTEYSIASFLNMNYVDDILEKLGPNSSDYKIPAQLKAHSNVLKIFKSYGYKTTIFHTGFGEKYEISEKSPFIDEKFCGTQAFNIINPQIVRNILLPYLSEIKNITTKTTGDSYLHQFDNCMFSYVQNYESKNEQPHFVHVHLMLPHGGYRYDSDGNHIYREQNEGLDKEGYFDQLLFTQKKALELIDSIQKRHPETVIIVISDHGFRGEINWANPTDEDLLRGFNNISALYFPNKNIEIPENLSLVNIFRIFFNEYFETDYDLLKNKQVWYKFDPFYMEDVTIRLNSLIEK